MKGDAGVPFSGVTEAVSRYIAESSFENLSEEVVEVAKCALLDWIAVTLGAVKEPAAGILIDLIGEQGGEKQASILGSGIKTTALNAAFVNGTMSHILDYDDAHTQTRNHTSAPLAPAVLAIAESRGLSGREWLTAYIAGFEVSSRIGLALGRRYYEEGWHATSILGRFGAVAGACRLLGLNAAQVEHALGLAATQTGGIRSVFGTMGKPFHAGKASMDGMLSAMLSQRGFTGPRGVLDADSEYVSIFSGEYEPRYITEDLGRNEHILTNSFKLHAACLLLHPVIDGLLSIRREQALKPERIDRIELEVAPLCLSVTDKPKLIDALEGKFSVYFCSALAIAKGKAGSGEFSDATMHDPVIQALMKKVTVESRPLLGETESGVTVYTSDGSRYEKHVSNFQGGPGRRPGFDDILSKFRDMAWDAAMEDGTERIGACVRELETLNDMRDLMSLCCGAGS